MKIAFDENIPAGMLRVFLSLADGKRFLDHEIVDAKAYRPEGERGDEHWVRRFAAAGGQVVVSGDTRMRSRPHEIAALVESGVITYCFEPEWSLKGFFTKSAMLLHWWPKIEEHMGMAQKATCWEIPFQWTWKDLVDVTINPSKISRNKK